MRNNVSELTKVSEGQNRFSCISCRFLRHATCQFMIEELLKAGEDLWLYIGLLLFSKQNGTLFMIRKLINVSTVCPNDKCM